MSLAAPFSDCGLFSMTMFMDWMATNRNALIAFGAGNAPGYIAVPGGNYNQITVGGLDITKTHPAATLGNGPTFDGRSKPDILAPATGIYHANYVATDAFQYNPGVVYERVDPVRRGGRGACAGLRRRAGVGVGRAGRQGGHPERRDETRGLDARGRAAARLLPGRRTTQLRVDHLQLRRGRAEPRRRRAAGGTSSSAAAARRRSITLPSPPSPDTSSPPPSTVALHNPRRRQPHRQPLGRHQVRKLQPLPLPQLRLLRCREVCQLPRQRRAHLLPRRRRGHLHPPRRARRQRHPHRHLRAGAEHAYPRRRQRRRQGRRRRPCDVAAELRPEGRRGQPVDHGDWNWDSRVDGADLVSIAKSLIVTFASAFLWSSVGGVPKANRFFASSIV